METSSLLFTTVTILLVIRFEARVAYITSTKKSSQGGDDIVLMLVL